MSEQDWYWEEKGTHVNDYVAGLEKLGVARAHEEGVFVFGEKPQHVYCKSFVGLERAMAIS